jgi:hypothetical protein
MPKDYTDRLVCNITACQLARTSSDGLDVLLDLQECGPRIC